MKRHLDDLAIFGGTPAFAEPLHVGRPNIGDRDAFLSRVNDILDRRWLTNKGKYVQDFEARVAEIAGVNHAIAACNGAVGLEIAIRALDLTGEVIVPSFTFIATAHALEWQGITPVFADVDARTHMLDPASVAAAITPRTTGIIGVHLWGQVCDAAPLQELADAHGLKLLFDAAHAFGCARGGRPVGGFGEIEVFSFHATKFVNALEGGAIVTNDGALAQKMRLMKNFGFLGYDNVGYVGTNGKMNEVSAAMGLTSIDSMAEFIAINRRNMSRYRQRLADLAGIRVLDYDERDQLNYQYVVAEVGPESPIGRDQLLDLLWAEQILARRYFYPGCHRMAPYRERRSPIAAPLPVTERISGRVVVLPTGQAMTEQDIDVVCDVICFAAAHASDIRARLSQRPAVHQDVFAH